MCFFSRSGYTARWVAAAQCIVIGPVCVFVSFVGVFVGVCVCGICYHDNSKLRASIFTTLGLYR